MKARVPRTVRVWGSLVTLSPAEREVAWTLTSGVTTKAKAEREYARQKLRLMFEKAMTMFDGLSEVIRAHGGNVTSAPRTWPLRFDIMPTQSERLCNVLAQAGWTPRPRGTSTRVGHNGFSDVLIYEVANPKAR